jgi:CDP-diacylglycerol--serine O-phosphatidyltransferase
MLALLPVFLTQQGILDARGYPEVFGVWIVIVAWLMVSKVPTLSSKAIRVKREWQVVVLLGAAVVVGLMVTRFWLLLVILDLAYATVTAIAVVQYVRKRRST